jgi:large subunit ribosomal protein L10
MKKEQKSVLVENVYNELRARPNLYITDISGLDAANTSKLRRACFRRNIKLIMVKNTLLKKAFEKLDTDYTELHVALKGTTAIMLSEVNNAPAQLIKEFRKSSDKPILKGAYVEESFYIGDNQLDALVSIKSKNQLIADVIAMLQSPVRNVLGALQSAPNTIGGIVKTLEERTAA